MKGPSIVVVRHAVIALVSYFVAYTIAYCLVLGSFDFSLYVQYLYLGWTFHGLELPAFAWALSVLLFGVLLPLVLYFNRKILRAR